MRDAEDCVIRTRGLSAWAAEAQDRQTLLAGSSPHVRWICSGVPSADLGSDCPPAALNIPDKPTPVTNVRLDIRPGVDLSLAVRLNFGVCLLATDALNDAAARDFDRAYLGESEVRRFSLVYAGAVLLSQ
jgi:hypothetical protein